MQRSKYAPRSKKSRYRPLPLSLDVTVARDVKAAVGDVRSASAASMCCANIAAVVSYQAHRGFAWAEWKLVIDTI